MTADELAGPRICPDCGEEFDPRARNRRGPVPVHCGPECADKARRSRNAAHMREKRGADPEHNREIQQRAQTKWWAKTHAIEMAAAQVRREALAVRRANEQADRERQAVEADARKAARLVEREARKAAAVVRHEAALENKRVRRKAAHRRYHLAHPEKKRECKKRRKNRLRRENPEGYQMLQRSKLLRDYGMTPEDYEAMREAQGGVCAICHCPESSTRTDKFTGLPKVRSLAVDHDHATGQVRDLLCMRCNHNLAVLENDPERLGAMYAYIAFHKAKGVAA